MDEKGGGLPSGGEVPEGAAVFPEIPPELGVHPLLLAVLHAVVFLSGSDDVLVNPAAAEESLPNCVRPSPWPAVPRFRVTVWAAGRPVRPIDTVAGPARVPSELKVMLVNGTPSQIVS